MASVPYFFHLGIGGGFRSDFTIEFFGVFLYTVGMSDLQPKNILIYRADDNRLRLEVKLEEKTIWLSQRQIGELYQKGKATISEHIKNIFQDGELDPEATVRKFRTVQKEGDRQVERHVFYPDPFYSSLRLTRELL